MAEGGIQVSLLESGKPRSERGLCILVSDVGPWTVAACRQRGSPGVIPKGGGDPRPEAT